MNMTNLIVEAGVGGAQDGILQNNHTTGTYDIIINNLNEEIALQQQALNIIAYVVAVVIILILLMSVLYCCRKLFYNKGVTRALNKDAKP